MNNLTMTRSAELISNHIIHLFDQLTIDYQNSKSERQKLAATETDSEEFTILEEIELLTVDIRGYASQVKNYGQIMKNEESAVTKLQSLAFINIPSLVQWYLDPHQDYPLLKLYLKMLDYLRLMILEFIKC
ncbi:MAG: hypothetical protein AB4352_15020 [Hormoscilla sp.]